MENVGLHDDDGDAFVERALRRLDEESARARGVALAVARIHEDAREALRSGFRAETEAGEEVVMTGSRKRVPSARELVAGRCGKCRGSILFEVLSSTPERNDWLCPVCAANEVKATYLSVALRLMFKRSALEEALAKRPQDTRGSLHACRLVMNELNELIEQLEE